MKSAFGFSHLLAFLHEFNYDTFSQFEHSFYPFCNCLFIEWSRKMNEANNLLPPGDKLSETSLDGIETAEELHRRLFNESVSKLSGKTDEELDEHIDSLRSALLCLKAEYAGANKIKLERGKSKTKHLRDEQEKSDRLYKPKTQEKQERLSKAKKLEKGLSAMGIDFAQLMRMSEEDAKKSK